MKKPDPEKPKLGWSKLDSHFQRSMHVLEPTDRARGIRMTQFDESDTTRNAGQDQINKYALLFIMGKKNLEHVSKGSIYRGHVSAIIQRVQALPDIYSILLDSDAKLLTDVRELLKLPFALQTTAADKRTCASAEEHVPR